MKRLFPTALNVISVQRVVFLLCCCQIITEKRVYAGTAHPSSVPFRKCRCCLLFKTPNQRTKWPLKSDDGNDSGGYTIPWATSAKRDSDKLAQRVPNQTPSEYVRSRVCAMDDETLRQHLELRGVEVHNKVKGSLRECRENSLVKRLIEDYTEVPGAEPQLEGTTQEATESSMLAMLGVSPADADEAAPWRPYFPVGEMLPCGPCTLMRDGLTKSFQTVLLNGEDLVSDESVPLSIPRKRFLSTLLTSQGRRVPSVLLNNHIAGSGHRSVEPQAHQNMKSSSFLLNDCADRFDIYITYPMAFNQDGPIEPRGQPSVGLLFIPDEHGFTDPHIRCMADVLAMKGRQTVVVPDIHNGWAWNSTAMGGNRWRDPEQSIEFRTWALAFSQQKQDDVIDVALDWLRSREIFDSIGIFGVGRGGGSALRAAVRGMKTDLDSPTFPSVAESGVDVCVAICPREYDVDSISGSIECPVCCVYAEEDQHPHASMKAGKRMERGLGRNRKISDFLVRSYPDVQQYFVQCPRSPDDEISNDALLISSTYQEQWTNYYGELRKKCWINTQK